MLASALALSMVGCGSSAVSGVSEQNDTAAKQKQAQTGGATACRRWLIRP